MQNAGNCNSTGISVQHKFALQVRLRQGSCLNQSQLDGVESLLLLIPPGESRAQAGNSMQGYLVRVIKRISQVKTIEQL